jgi:hypothetical protein
MRLRAHRELNPIVFIKSKQARLNPAMDIYFADPK